MSSDVSTRTKSGRKAESAEAKARRLHNEWKMAVKAAEVARERKLAKLAAAIVAEAKSRPELAATIREILPRHVTSKALLAQLVVLLDEEISGEQKAAA